MVIGIVFAWILGLGILLITLLSTSARAGQATITIQALSEAGAAHQLTDRPRIGIASRA